MGRRTGTPTDYPGVKRAGEGLYLVRVKATDPRTGRPRQVERLVEARGARQASLERDRLAAELRPMAGSTPTVAEYALSWLESRARAVDASTLSYYATTVTRHIVPVLGDLRCDQIRPYDVQTWVNGLRQAPSTVGKTFSVMRAMMRDAAVQLDLPRDPCMRITLPRKLPSERVPLPEGALSRFLRAAVDHEPDSCAILATLVLTGLRYVHASALRWDDVDLDAGLAKVRLANRRGRLGPLSAIKRAPQSMPLPAVLADILRAHRERLRSKSVVALAGWVFPGQDPRRPVGHHVVQRAYTRTLVAAGLDLRSSPHKLRATLIDEMRRAGVDPVTQRALVGHATEAMREHYSTVPLAELRRAVDAVAEVVRMGADDGADRKRRKRVLRRETDARAQ